MKPDQHDGEKAQRKLNDWKSLVENLNIILQYKTVELKDGFEYQKKNLSEWLESKYDRFLKVNDISEEKAQKLKSSLENLRVQAATGRAHTNDELLLQQQKISNGIQQLKLNITEAYDLSKEEIKNFAEEVADKSNDFHTRFDLFKLQLYLGKAETKENWERKKKEISNELQAMNDKIANGYDDQIENWDHFSSEVSKAWQRIKRGFAVDQDEN